MSTRLCTVLFLSCLSGCFPGPLPEGQDGSSADQSATDSDGDGVLAAPHNVTATTDRLDDVEIQWEAVEGASGYRVFRCSLACDGDWVELTTSPTADRAWIDATAEVSKPANAPTQIIATTDRTDEVLLTWVAPSPRPAPRYAYRVVSLDLAHSSDPSSSVEGGCGVAPIEGYAIEIDGEPWLDIGSELAWSDGDAAAPTLSVGSISASNGTLGDRVHLVVEGANETAGTERVYRVRAYDARGPGDASTAAHGWRSAGPIRLQWERSAGPSADAFAAMTGASTATYDDFDAPENGEVRWYRVVVTASGASSIVSAAKAGARAPPPNVPGAVTAIDDVDHVLVTWQPVVGAVGYQVYRNGVRLTPAEGISLTSYMDKGAPPPAEGWAAPVEPSASDTLVDEVEVRWTAPTRPLGESQSYQVAAVNAAGEGELSASASGRRVAPALIGFEVEAKPSGGNSSWSPVDADATAWTDENAPPPLIEAGTMAVSQGEFRAHVLLGSSGAAATPGQNVTYRVRGVLAGGEYTPISEGVTGHRAVGTLALQWERSSTTEPSGFSAITSESEHFDDEAPSDGAKRWYRLVLSAAGAVSVTVPAQEGWRLAFVTVEGGSGFACALTSAGVIWCWGVNQYGQLGRGLISESGTMAPLPGPERFIAIATGGFHACGVATSRKVYCWGRNESGQLGVGDDVSRSIPTMVDASIGDAAAIAAGIRFSCAANTTGEVWCWGSEALGNGGAIEDASLVPTQVRTATGSLNGVLSLGGGLSHVCARKIGTTFCWGKNGAGQLGNATTDPATVAMLVGGLTGSGSIDGGDLQTCAVESGSVKCWGGNLLSALGDGTDQDSSTPVKVIGLAGAAEVATSPVVSCARTFSGEVRCWGYDGGGARGDGATVTAATAQPTIAYIPYSASDLAAGWSFVCAVASNELWCWGSSPLGVSSDAPAAIELP